MRSLFRFLIRYHFLILFLIIEFFSIYLVVQNNLYQKAKIINIGNSVSGFFYDRSYAIVNYFELKKTNKQLLEENNKLRNKIENLKHRCEYFVRHKKESPVDTSLYKQDTLIQYKYIYARVINNSINKQYNFLTLNKGATAGIESEMGVISSGGVVGIALNITPNYTSVISVLNRKLQISAKIKKNQYYGSLSWDGNNYQIVNLREIPYHVDIQKGDTIVTSGYSAIFPEGIMIGYIEDFDIKEGNFYNISVKLANDMKNLTYVYLIKNNLRGEQKKLEKSVIQ
jgi:rod shape-determining protein MreC